MRTRQEVAAGVYAEASERNRQAQLNLHINLTVARCLESLRMPFRTIARNNVLEIITEAAPRYIELGGNLHPWTPTRAAEVFGRPVSTAFYVHRGTEYLGMPYQQEVCTGAGCVHCAEGNIPVGVPASKVEGWDRV